MVAAVHTAGGDGSQGNDAIVCFVLESASTADPSKVLAIFEDLDDNPRTAGTAAARLRTWRQEDTPELWCANRHAPLSDSTIDTFAPPSQRGDLPHGNFGAAEGLLRVAQACTALNRRVLPAAHTRNTMAPSLLVKATPWIHDRASGLRRAQLPVPAPTNAGMPPLAKAVPKRRLSLSALPT